MIRTWMLAGAMAALAAATLPLDAAAPAAHNPWEAAAPQPARAEALRQLLTQSGRHVALHYDQELTGTQVIARAHGDAAKLGMPLVKTLAAGRVALLEGTPAQLEARLRALEVIPARAISPVYLQNGDPHPDSMIVFTDRLAVRFAEGTSEGAKARFLAGEGLEREREFSDGTVYVRAADGEPGFATAERADALERSGLIASASPEFLFTGSPSASDSIQIADPLFDLQWYLFNSEENTNFGLGVPDEDIDGPRAWMFNQRNAREVEGAQADDAFGAGIVVGVFDSGTEINHDDLAANIDFRLGTDYVNAGQPLPEATILGAHGTVVAGLIGADNNNIGVVGLAPDSRIYTFRIFGPDYSTSNLIVSRALNESVSLGIDVNVHPYSLPIEGALSTEVEEGLRRAVESGRGGIGTPNVAASGNFFAQVEYPASSEYTYAVGGVTDFGSRSPDTNYNGVGLDFSMPSYYVTENWNVASYGTGLVSTDLTGNQGVATLDAPQNDNPLGRYAGIGNVEGFQSLTNGAGTFVFDFNTGTIIPVEQTTSAFQFGGTSVATALAGGTVALMLNDFRYTAMPPLGAITGLDSRQGRTQRAPFNASNILSQLLAHADLPTADHLRDPLVGNLSGIFFDFGAGDLPQALLGYTGLAGLPIPGMFNYINQYNEFLGKGRPNPAKFLAVNDDFDPGTQTQTGRGVRGVATNDSLFLFDQDTESELFNRYNGQTIYSVAFNQVVSQGSADVLIDPATGLDTVFDDSFAQGWSIEDGAALTLFGPDTVDPDNPGPPDRSFTLSPYLQPVEAIFFADGQLIPPNLDNDPDTQEFFVVWTDSHTFLPDQAPSDNEGEDLLYNPFGRYRRSTDVGLVSPEILLPDDYNGEPMIVSLQVAHALGVEDSSTALNIGLTQYDIIPEIDTLALEMAMNDVDAEDSGTTTSVTIRLAELTGDSRTPRKTRLVNATAGFDDQTDTYFPTWPPVENVPYRPFVREEQMTVRTYSFAIPPLPPNMDNIQFTLRLEPGNSYLPSYFLDDNLEYAELFNIYRDEQGFLFYGMEVTTVSREHFNYLRETNFVVNTDATMPSWSASTSDVFSVMDDEDLGPATELAVSAPRPLYLGEDRQEVLRKPTQQMVQSDDRITGLKGHPFLELLAMTTDDGNTQELWVMTTDGVNQSLLVNPQLSQGARDPSWAPNGRQVVYSSDDYVRIASLDTTIPVAGEAIDANVETIVSSESTPLMDFRSPVVDADSGFVIFVARKQPQFAEGDNSLNLYVATRVGRVINYATYSGCAEGPARETFSSFLYGWEGVDVYDLDLASDGSRLIFTANASQAPTPPPNCSQLPGLDPTFDPATPSDASALFVIENFQNVLNFNDSPVYRRVALSTPPLNPYDDQSADGFTVSSVRFPRFSPGGDELLYVAMEENGVVTSDLRGRIFRQPIAPATEFPPVNEPEPTPATGTPVPTQTPPDPGIGQVTLFGQYDFFIDLEGWEFKPLEENPDFRAAEGRFSREGAGSLVIEAPNSLATFGFWESPRGAINIRPGSMYLYRAYVSTTEGTSAAEAPSLRLRVNSSNLENAYTSQTDSSGDLALAPGPDLIQTFDLLFRPATGLENLPLDRQWYTIAFDMFNFFPDNSPVGGLELHRTELFRLDEGGKYFALWSFIPQQTGTITFSAIPGSAVEGQVAMGVRTFCDTADSELACTSGEAGAGLTINNMDVDAGTTYTVVVASEFAQEITLNWNSTTILDPAAARIDGPLVPFCGNSMPISGASGTATQQAVYGGNANIDAPNCASSRNASVITLVEPVYEQDMSDPDALEDWTNPGRPIANFSQPEYLVLEDGLAIRVLDRTNTFGYWSASGGKIPVGSTAPLGQSPVAIYRGTFTIASDFEPDPLRMPTIRVRLSTNEFQRTTEGWIGTVLNGLTVPTPGRERNVVVYMVLEEPVSTFTNIVAGFDIISFEPGRDITNQPVELRNVRIEKVAIPNYPLPTR